MRFEKIKILEGAILLKTLDERVLASNLLEYLYTAKIYKYTFLWVQLLKCQTCKNFFIFKFKTKRTCSVKKIFLKFTKFHGKTSVLKSVLNFIKKRLQHRCLPVKFTKFLIIPILKNIWERLLLAKLNRNINPGLSWRHWFLYNNVINC